ncbi:unnamed protein product [Owenia fusiformis]|uniref:Uncharacterized protein n=1 Tax=Owenia fusiformis TaxID=6347 RepID=A0A8S4Q035_OWEFU|nr:unnamed protein product [Owenia fusiformis]
MNDRTYGSVADTGKSTRQTNESCGHTDESNRHTSQSKGHTNEGINVELDDMKVNGIKTGDEADFYDVNSKENEGIIKVKREKMLMSRLFKYKMAKTLLIVISWVVNGMLLSIRYPTMPDLRARLGVNYEELSRALIGRDVGWAMGSFIAGITYDKFQSTWDLQLAVGFFLEALAVGIKPWCNGLVLLGLSYWVEGVAHGLYGLVGNAMMIALWGKHTPSPMHSMHFGWRTGAFLAPTIAYPFLSGRIEVPMLINSTANSGTLNTTYTMPTNGTGFILTESEIIYPYLITGVLGLLASLAYLVFFIGPRPPGIKYTNTAKSRQLKKFLSPASCAGGNMSFGVLMMICLTSYYFFVEQLGNVFVSFQTAVATKNLNMTEQEAALVNSASTGTGIGAHFLMILLAKCIPMPLLIFGEMHGILAVSAAAIFIVLNDVQGFWILSCAFRFFSAALWAGGMAWSENYIDITGAAIMLWDIGAGVGGVLFNYLGGYLLTNHGASAILWLDFGGAVTMCALLYVTQVVMSHHGHKYRKD